jgi:hypothetical protein
MVGHSSEGKRTKTSRKIEARYKKENPRKNRRKSIKRRKSNSRNIIKSGISAVKPRSF